MTFAVIRIESPPEHLRGYLERFLFEIRTGLYAGTASRKVIDKLWETITNHIKDGDAIIVFPTNNEAGFQILETPHSRYRLVDHDGLTLTSTVRTLSEPTERDET